MPEKNINIQKEVQKISTFTIKEMVEFMDLANLAYLQDDKNRKGKLPIIKDLEKNKNYKFHFFGKNNIHSGIIVELPKEIFISYQGTTSKWNAATDAYGKLFKSEYLKGSIHSGFYREFNKTKNIIISKLIDIIKKDNKYLEKQKLKNPNINQIELIKNIINNFNLRITISGHSMGSALAFILAYYLTDYIGINPELIRILGIATPPVFNDIAANEYNKLLGNRTLSIIENFDPLANILSLFNMQKSLGYKTEVGNTIMIKTPEDHMTHSFGGYRLAMKKIYEEIKKNNSDYKFNINPFNKDINKYCSNEDTNENNNKLLPKLLNNDLFKELENKFIYDV